jgi:hypothetical protein
LWPCKSSIWPLIQGTRAGRPLLAQVRERRPAKRLYQANRRKTCNIAWRMNSADSTRDLDTVRSALKRDLVGANFEPPPAQANSCVTWSKPELAGRWDSLKE